MTTEDDEEAASDDISLSGSSKSDFQRQSSQQSALVVLPTQNGVVNPPRMQSVSSVPRTTYLFWSFSARQKLLLLALGMVELTSNMSLSLLAPFFPKEAAAKNISNTISGWVFGVFALVQFLAAPIIGKLMPTLGPTFLFLIGPFFGGGCTVLFGFLSWFPTENGNELFLAFCFILRVFMALGCSCGSTSSFALTADAFPDNVAFTFGVLETFAGLGMMIGPALGGFLYSLGGYMLPFVLLGSLMIISTPINYFILPQNSVAMETDSKTGISISEFLQVPAISISCIAVVVGALVWSILDPTLEPHLAEFDMDTTMLGLVFLLMSAFYAVGAPIAGWICDKIPDSSPLLVTGFASCSVGMLLLGPSPILGFPQGYNELWMNIVALVILGISSSIAIVPTFDKILDAAEKAGIEDNMRMYGLVAGLWSSMYALGDFIGPSVGGVLVDTVGFPWCMTIIAIVCLFMAFIMTMLWLYESRCGPTPIVRCSTCCHSYNKELTLVSDSSIKCETTPLLSGSSNKLDISVDKVIHPVPQNSYSSIYDYTMNHC